MKKCTRCGISKNVDDFHKCKTEKNGLQFRCKDCYRQSQREIYAKYKTKYQALAKERRAIRVKKLKELFYQFKILQKCQICEESDWRCLDFHHTNPANKKDKVTNMIYSRYAWKIILEEIAKCEILCANCHRAKSYTKIVLTKRNKFVYNQRMKLNQYKVQNGCSICGFNKHPESLDFHHTNPENKNDGVSALIDKSWLTIETEIQKCELLCANCHRKEHIKEREEGGG